MTDKITEFDELEEGEWYHYDHDHVPDPEEITLRFKNLDTDDITQQYADGFEIVRNREGIEGLIHDPGIVRGKA